MVDRPQMAGLLRIVLSDQKCVATFYGIGFHEQMSMFATKMRNIDHGERI